MTAPDHTPYLRETDLRELRKADKKKARHVAPVTAYLARVK